MREVSINRLMIDLAKLAELLEYTTNIDYSVMSLGTFTDKKADTSLGGITNVQEIVYNRERDREFVDVELRVTKIYNAFLYGKHDYWRNVILNNFEAQTQIDFMLLVSFIYMVDNSDNKEDRELNTCAEIAYVLSKFTGTL